MSDFKAFFEKKRADFDELEEVPTGKMWEQIRRDMEFDATPKEQEQARKLRVFRNLVIGMAATIALLIFVNLSDRQSQNSDREALISFVNPVEQIDASLAETEQDFKRLISIKEQDLNIQNIDKQLFSDIFRELEELEQIHIEYQQDIPLFKDKDQLVNTLIRYYEQKIRILERLTREIEFNKLQEKRNHEKNI